MTITPHQHALNRRNKFATDVRRHDSRGEVQQLIILGIGCHRRVGASEEGVGVGAAWLVTGPVLNTRVKPRRVALWGPEARG